MKRFFAIVLGCFFLLALSLPVFAQSKIKALVEGECGRGHGIKKVTNASKTPAEWSVTLDRMIKKGAKIEAADKDAVLKYLNTLNK